MDSYHLRDRNSLREPVRFGNDASEPGEDTAKRRRPGKKASITKKIKTIRELINKNGSRTKLGMFQAQLNKLLDEACS